MSTTFGFYIGPFAEWLVPKANHLRVWKRLEPLLDEFDASACRLERYELEREVVVGRSRFIRECWMASFALPRDAAPPRKFFWDQYGEVGIWEFSGLDAEQEKQWFQRAFAAQLSQLAAAYGCEPSIKWGAVARRD
jgi:hypothetical protein